MSHKYDSVEALLKAGIGFEDAKALRRISMTLQRWFELECGNSNNYGDWAIVRGRKEGREFVHDDDGAAYMERHHYMHGKGQDYTTHTKIRDAEKGARTRLAVIMTRYEGFHAYVQTNPRGAALYILRPGDLRDGDQIDCVYTRGICVCK